MFKVQENALDELPYSITCLQFAYLAYEANPDRLHAMRYLDCCMDDSYEIAERALACYCDLIMAHSYENNNECFVHSCYYSSDTMREFYELCRAHAKHLHVKLCEEPFLIQAERFVRAQLGNAYSFDYTLHTKVNRQYASGIAVRFTEEFCECEEFNMAMIDIMQFYQDKTLQLKTALAAMLQTTSTPARQEEAA
ncbi:MAG: hypothetical protein ACLUBZ_00295 [Ruthenibacterium lactatiformans]|jgi:hypothetical protein|uniref:hypothetical protein n=1 Tax=Ruthenibacterium lactatiformans TaxID=1550024 RepID=UPI003995E4C8